MIKSGFLEFKRALHPNAIIQSRYNGKVVSKEIIGNILGFFILYMISFIVGSLVFGLIGLDFENAIGVAASSLGNVGPAIGDFGPANNYSQLPSLGKYWSSFLMLIGRLELFTVLILFTPFFIYFFSKLSLFFDSLFLFLFFNITSIIKYTNHEFLLFFIPKNDKD